MRNAHRLSGPAYALALMLLLFPFFDLVLQIWPIQLGQAQWRFGSVGIASRMLITPFLGLFIGYAVAYFLGHHRVLQLFTAMSAVTAVALLAFLGLFALDGLEVRALVTADAVRRFDLTALIAAVKLGLAMLVAVVYTLMGMRAARSAGRRAKAAGSGPGIVASHDLGDLDPEGI